MKGMPNLYYATAGERRTRWVGHTLVISAEAEEVRRLYEYEDAAPEAPTEVPPTVLRGARFARIRQLFGASGA
jgi:hypothetical protein